jgi:hypothetical protein
MLTAVGDTGIFVTVSADTAIEATAETVGARIVATDTGLIAEAIDVAIVASAALAGNTALEIPTGQIAYYKAPAAVATDGVGQIPILVGTDGATLRYISIYSPF